MKLNHLLTIMGLITALVTTSCNRRVIERKPDTSSSRVLIDWNIAAFEAMGGATYQHSLMASRINAMVHIAMHDAINAVQPKFEQYAYKQTVPSANMEAAAVYAAYTVLSASFPAKKQMLDSILSISMTGIEDGDSKTKGIEVGVDAAHAILHKRAGDGADINPVVAIPASNIPGVYNVVPPFDFVFAPHWKTMRLFGLKTHNQFRPGAPPSLNSTTYIEDLNEVKAVGEKNSTTRTADQTFYSQFWYEFSEAGWNRVARTCINDKKLGIAEGARLLALLNMALADAYTAGWDAKFHYNFWRPYTAIRSAAKGSVNASANWESFMPTPPVQDYPSTHSALGNAGAAVLISVLGDVTPFTMTSFTAVPAGATRSFNSFSEAADENADSRVMAGIHFRFSCEAGQIMGTDIGNFIVQNHLKPR